MSKLAASTSGFKSLPVPQRHQPCATSSKAFPNDFLRGLKWRGAGGSRSKLAVSDDMQELFPAVAVPGDESELSDNVWKYKPAWCQPPTIVLTGLMAIFFTYSVSNHSVWFTGPVVLFVGLWWKTFLIEYPEEFRMYILEKKQQEIDASRAVRKMPEDW